MKRPSRHVFTYESRYFGKYFILFQGLANHFLKGQTINTLGFADQETKFRVPSKFL